MTQERVLCLRCLKPQVTCYCSQVRPFRSDFEIVILQHPLERRKTVGTARMVHLCVENSRILHGEQFINDPEVERIIADPRNRCVALFPGPEAVALDTLSDAEKREWLSTNEDGRKLVVFVIDGSWSFAKKMLKRSPSLSRLPRVCFTPTRESEYRIRHQPKPYCVSTVEAVHRLFEILNPNVDAGNLLEVFRSMVSQQVRYAGLNQLRRST